MKKLGMGIVIGFSCMLGFAAQADASSGWTTWGTITSYQDYGLGAEVELSAPVIKPASCTGSRYRASTALPSEAAKDRLTRAILAAYLAGRSIRLKIDNVCTTDNQPGYYAVDLEP
jgi:hypothetical protein